MNLVRTAWVTALLAFLLTAVLFFLEGFFPAVRLVNWKGRDFFFRLKHDLLPPPPEAREIVLVVIDDGTLRRLTTRWPYPRSLYAEALKHLKSFSPKAIGLDFVFSGNDFLSAGDETFAQALRDAGNVVIGTHWSPQGEVGPSPLLIESAYRVGVVDKPRDPDRVIRRSYLTFPAAGSSLRSWEFEIFSTAYSQAARGDLYQTQPLIIDYRLRVGEFQQVPFWKLFETKIDDPPEANKIFLVGLNSEAFHDIHATPLGSMPGLGVNGNVLLTILSRTFFGVVPRWALWSLAFLAFWLALLSTVSSTVVGGGLIIFALLLLYLCASFFLFALHLVLDVWLIAIGMMLIFIGATAFREGRLFLENLKLREESTRDPLTGFYSRRFLELKLRSELGRLRARLGAVRRVREISVVMIDLDNFKLVNDSFGHAEGDRVLRTMAEAIRSSVRKEELICRYGGDEFCVILINTWISDAAKFAEKLRVLVAEHPDLVYRTGGGVGTIRVTASIGVASVAGLNALDSGKLLKAADKALYRAKEGGRNQVCVFDGARDRIE